MEETLLNKTHLNRLDIFLRLPRMAQEQIWLDLAENKISGKDLFDSFWFFKYNLCDSPIEVIFNYYFDRVIHFDYKDYDFNLLPQEEILVANNHYRADFLIECFWYEFNENKDIPVKEYYSKVIVECDGHDFHEKTKAQVKRRNERDYNLQMGGYDLIHFSGSEIFNNPEECAKKVIEYLIKHLKPWEE